MLAYGYIFLVCLSWALGSTFVKDSGSDSDTDKEHEFLQTKPRITRRQRTCSIYFEPESNVVLKNGQWCLLRGKHFAVKVDKETSCSRKDSTETAITDESRRNESTESMDPWADFEYYSDPRKNEPK